MRITRFRVFLLLGASFLMLGPAIGLGQPGGFPGGPPPGGPGQGRVARGGPTGGGRQGGGRQGGGRQGGRGGFQPDPNMIFSMLSKGQDYLTEADYLANPFTQCDPNCQGQDRVVHATQQHPQRPADPRAVRPILPGADGAPATGPARPPTGRRRRARPRRPTPTPTAGTSRSSKTNGRRCSAPTTFPSKACRRGSRSWTRTRMDRSVFMSGSKPAVRRANFRRGTSTATASLPSRKPCGRSKRRRARTWPVAPRRLRHPVVRPVPGRPVAGRWPVKRRRFPATPQPGQSTEPRIRRQLGSISTALLSLRRGRRFREASPTPYCVDLPSPEMPMEQGDGSAGCAAWGGGRILPFGPGRRVEA